MKSKRIKWKDRTLENDIKYGGFLSYRHLRLIGWACLIIAQVSVILQFEVKLAPETADVVEKWNYVISVFAGLPIPLFLLANLSTILQSRGNYKPLFIRFGALAAIMYLLGNFIVFHYGFRTLLAFNNTVTWADAARVFGQILPAFGKTGYMLNIFIDMLLVLFMFFFTNYVPKTKIFAGKRIFIFRALILLPIAYEVAGIILKYNVSVFNFAIPSPVFFLLPSKPPLIFGAFVVIVVGLKLSEFRYLRRQGHTQEDFEEHVKTKAHSLKISIGIAATFIVFAIIDLALALGLTLGTIARVEATYADYSKEVIATMISAELEVLESVGIGSATGLILAAPLVLLFSYTKTHKNPKIDLFIPVGGIVLIALVLLEGSFQVVTLNMPIFIQKLKDAVERILGGGEENPPESARAIINLLQNIHL